MLNVNLFFFKQKTAYEMRISDWSSDVCSSDLRYRARDRKRRQEDDRRDRRWRQFPQMADRHPAGAIWRRLSSLGRRTHAAGDGAFHRHGKRPRYGRGFGRYADGEGLHIAAQPPGRYDVGSGLSNGWGAIEDRKSTRLNSSH